MEHLAARGITCPQPVKNRSGEALGTLCRAARGDHHLPRRHVDRAGRTPRIAPRSARRWRGCISPARFSDARAQCAVGRRLAAAVRSAAPRRQRAAGPARASSASSIISKRVAARPAARRDPRRSVSRQRVLPRRQAVGLIDFLFRLHRHRSPTTSRSASTPGASSRSFLQRHQGRARCCNAYGRARPLSDAERDALPLLARGAALRFLLTRLVDWLNVPPGALVRPKDPLEYFRKLRFHQARRERARLRRRRSRGCVRERSAARHRLHRRRLLGQSRAGRLGRDPEIRRHEKELKGGEPHTTNNRMELMAAISALEALKRPCTVDLTPTASMCATASPAGSTAGSATAGAPPTRSRSRTSICGSGSMPRCSTHEVRWHWVKGHAGQVNGARRDVVDRGLPVICR
jgi:homoserine kinase type II